MDDFEEELRRRERQNLSLVGTFIDVMFYLIIGVIIVVSLILIFVVR